MLHQYQYRSKWTTIVFCALFFGVCAIVLGFAAITNRGGLLISGITDLSPRGATIFYSVLSAASVGFVGIAAAMAIARLSLRQQIAINDRCVSIPLSAWSNEQRFVPFADIKSLSETKVHSHRFLKIVYSGGAFTIVNTNLPEKDDFDEIYQLLAHRMDAQRFE